MADSNFLVKIGDAQYKVSAPDENTAWQWANQTHSESAKKTPEPYDIPAGLKSLMNVGQAVSFGFGDEIAGALGADKERYRSTIDQFTKEYPKSALLGTVSGSALLPFGAGKLAAQSPWTAAATTGAITGALQGAGDATTLENTPNEASRGALFGGIAGPAILGMAKPVGSAASALATKIPYFGDDIANLVARKNVARAFERDSTDAQQVGRRMVQIGPEARVGDAAGESTRNLLDLNANLPGKTATDLESTIRGRIATRPDRMDSMVYAVNGGYGRAKGLETALTQQQSQIASPLYQKAHAMDVAPTSNLVRDLEAARKLGAFSEAEKRALANPDNGPFTLDAAQQVLGKGKIAVRDIDHIKQGIDSLIETNTDAVTGKVSGYGRDLVKLKNRILSEVDGAVPDYKAAREAYAGPAAMKTAITKGKAFWNEGAESLGDTIAGMTQSEQQAFRVGASEALREKVGSQSGQTQLLNLWKDRNLREKMRALLGSDVKYSEVEAMIGNEATLKRMEALGPSRNSRTFSREAGAENQTAEVAGDLLSAGMKVKTGQWLSLLGDLKQQSARIGSPEPVRDAIGKILLKQYAPEEMRALMAAQEIIRRQQSAASIGAGVAGGKSRKGILE
jgi:hypothetical protein